MMRVEENKMIIGTIGRAAEQKPTGTYEEMVVFKLDMIANVLADISKSLAIIADKAKV